MSGSCEYVFFINYIARGPLVHCSSGSLQEVPVIKKIKWLTSYDSLPLDLSTKRVRNFNVSPYIQRKDTFDTAFNLPSTEACNHFTNPNYAHKFTAAYTFVTKARLAEIRASLPVPSNGVISNSRITTKRN